MSASTFLKRRWLECRELARFLGRHWLATALVLIAYGFACRYLMINITPSLPYRVVWMDYGATPVRGDLVVFRFSGTPLPSIGYRSGARMFKRIAGIEGDEIAVTDRTVSIAGTPVGEAKPVTSAGERLDPIAPGLVPADHYFVQATHPDSFDSRYAQSGLIHRSQIIGVAHVVF